LSKLDTKFDITTAADLQTNASAKLLQMLKEKQKAKKASSTREFAVRCVRGLQATIHQLFEEGASINEVLSQLIESLPSIPPDDLRYALRAISAERKKRLRASSSTPAASIDTGTVNIVSTQTHSLPKIQKIANPESRLNATVPLRAGTANVSPDLPAWADGSDKRADESDDDYKLRKEIEGPPDARHKFIGEHKA
jgi:hypothetical protein